MTSGNKWQGSIKEFKVEVHFALPILLDRYSYFFSIDGNYRNDTFRDNHEQVISLQSGKLYYKAVNFLPKDDMLVQFYSREYVMLQERFGEKISLYSVTNQILKDEDLKKCSKEELKILRNSIYAWYGYKFSDPYLDKYFKSKCWYWPIEKAYIQFNNIENQNIKSIIEIEEGK